MKDLDWVMSLTALLRKPLHSYSLCTVGENVSGVFHMRYGMLYIKGPLLEASLSRGSHAELPREA